MRRGDVDGCFAGERAGAWSWVGAVGGSRVCWLGGAGIGVVEMHGEVLGCSCEAHSWSFDAKFAHGNHHSADELVATLETEELILPVGFVEEDNVESDGVAFIDGAEFGKNVLLVFAIFGCDELEESFAESIDLVKSGAELDGHRDGFCETS